MVDFFNEKDEDASSLKVSSDEGAGRIGVSETIVLVGVDEERRIPVERAE